MPGKNKKREVKAMIILQVKKYNNTIAQEKEQKALARWRERLHSEGRGYGYPVKSMFYFMLSDSQGYPTELRQRGYIAFDEHRAVFGFTPEEAQKDFEKYQ